MQFSPLPLAPPTEGGDPAQTDCCRTLRPEYVASAPGRLECQLGQDGAYPEMRGAIEWYGVGTREMQCSVEEITGDLTFSILLRDAVQLRMTESE